MKHSLLFHGLKYRQHIDKIVIVFKLVSLNHCLVPFFYASLHSSRVHKKYYWHNPVPFNLFICFFVFWGGFLDSIVEAFFI